MTLEFYRDYFSYDHWCNRRVLESLAGIAANDRPLRFLAHIIGAQDVWMARLIGGVAPAGPWPELTLDECVARVEELRRIWSEYLADELDLNRVVKYRTFTGVQCVTAVVDILTHVNNHSTYHRGQIATAVKELGGTPAATDFIAYVWAVR